MVSVQVGYAESLKMNCHITRTKPNVCPGRLRRAAAPQLFEISHIFALLVYAYGTNPIVPRFRYQNYGMGMKRDAKLFIGAANVHCHEIFDLNPVLCRYAAVRVWCAVRWQPSLCQAGQFLATSSIHCDIVRRCEGSESGSPLSFRFLGPAAQNRRTKIFSNWLQHRGRLGLESRDVSLLLLLFSTCIHLLLTC